MPGPWKFRLLPSTDFSPLSGHIAGRWRRSRAQLCRRIESHPGAGGYAQRVKKRLLSPKKLSSDVHGLFTHLPLHSRTVGKDPPGPLPAAESHPGAGGFGQRVNEGLQPAKELCPAVNGFFTRSPLPPRTVEKGPLRLRRGGPESHPVSGIWNESVDGRLPNTQKIPPLS